MAKPKTPPRRSLAAAGGCKAGKAPSSGRWRRGCPFQCLSPGRGSSGGGCTTLARAGWWIWRRQAAPAVCAVPPRWRARGGGVESGRRQGIVPRSERAGSGPGGPVVAVGVFCSRPALVVEVGGGGWCSSLRRVLRDACVSLQHVRHGLVLSAQTWCGCANRTAPAFSWWRRLHWELMGWVAQIQMKILQRPCRCRRQRRLWASLPRLRVKTLDRALPDRMTVLVLHHFLLGDVICGVLVEGCHDAAG